MHIPSFMHDELWFIALLEDAIENYFPQCLGALHWCLPLNGVFVAVGCVKDSTLNNVYEFLSFSGGLGQEVTPI